MSDYILYSIAATVVLTIVVNVVPLLFPNATAKVQKEIEKNARKIIEQHEDANYPRVKVFFPWKVMLIGSIILTLLVNLVQLLSL